MYLTEDPIGAGLNGPADGPAGSTADGVIGGAPAGPGPAAGALIGLAAAGDRAYDRLADWAENRSLAPASAAGISLILGICAATWFSAGTGPGNLYGAAALAAGYLVALGSREFLGPVDTGLADPAGAAAAEPDRSLAGLVPGTSAARSAWLAVLGARLSEYAVYVGLAIGAAAAGWRGVWPLTIAVLGLAAVCDTMNACSRPARPAAGAPGRSARAGAGRDDAGLDDTIPDVPAWEGTAPDVLGPDGAADPARGAPAAAARPLSGLAPDGLPGVTPGRAAGLGPGDAEAAEPGPARPGLGGLAGRALLTALSVPPGGRVLLVILAAPIFGSQPTLLGLLDWGIIGVGFGIGSRTAARHRDRDRNRRDDRLAAGDLDHAEARDEPGGLAVLLHPARPDLVPDSPAELTDDPPAPVVRSARSPSGMIPDPVAGPDQRALRAAAGPEPDPAAFASELTAAAAVDSAAVAGDSASGPALGVARADESGPAAAGAGRPDAGLAADGPHPGGARFGRLFGARGGPGRRPRAAGLAGDAVYDWADDGWTDSGGADEDQLSGRTPEALADQAEWDAELAAGPQLPDGAPPGAPSGPAGWQPGDDYLPPSGRPGPDADPVSAGYPTLAERLGLSRDPEPGPYPGPDEDAADAAGYASWPDGPDDDPDAAGAAGGQPEAAVLRNRDDGALARWFGSLVRGQLMPLPAALLALAAVAMLAHLGLRDLPGLLILAPALVMLVAAPGASHRHDGRFDWLVPAVLQGAQYVYIGALGFAAGVPAAITFLLCAAVALHYADLGSAGSPILLAVRRAGSPQVPRRRRPAVRRTAARSGRPRRSFQERLGQRPPAGSPGGGQDARPDRPGGQSGHGARPSPVTELGMWMGWEGRMIAVGLGAAMGVAMFAYLALAGYLTWLVGAKIRASYLGLREGDVR